jgi:hypothetical protein
MVIGGIASIARDMIRIRRCWFVAHGYVRTHGGELVRALKELVARL